jgi:hypothetical protein
MRIFAYLREMGALGNICIRWTRSGAMAVFEAFKQELTTRPLRRRNYVDPLLPSLIFSFHRLVLGGQGAPATGVPLVANRAPRGRESGSRRRNR